MISVTINVLSTISENITVVTPTNGDSVRNVYIALIQETHYVGLDVFDDHNKDETNVDACSNSEVLDDSTIEKGDEHNMQITGGPQVCSVLSVENPEAEGQVYSCSSRRATPYKHNDRFTI